MKPPSFIECSICGREFGSKSILIHEKQCLQKLRKTQISTEPPPNSKKSKVKTRKTAKNNSGTEPELSLNLRDESEVLLPKIAPEQRRTSRESRPSTATLSHPKFLSLKNREVDMSLRRIEYNLARCQLNDKMHDDKKSSNGLLPLVEPSTTVRKFPPESIAPLKSPSTSSTPTKFPLSPLGKLSSFLGDPFRKQGGGSESLEMRQMSRKSRFTFPLLFPLSYSSSFLKKLSPKPQNPLPSLLKDQSGGSDFKINQSGTPDFKNNQLEGSDFKNNQSGSSDFKNDQSGAPDFKNDQPGAPDFKNGQSGALDFKNDHSEETMLKFNELVVEKLCKSQSEVVFSSKNQSDVDTTLKSQLEVDKLCKSQSEVVIIFKNQSDIDKSPNSQSEINIPYNNQSNFNKLSKNQSDISPVCKSQSNIEMPSKSQSEILTISKNQLNSDSNSKSQSEIEKSSKLELKVKASNQNPLKIENSTKREPEKYRFDEKEIKIRSAASSQSEIEKSLKNQSEVRILSKSQSEVDKIPDSQSEDELIIIKNATVIETESEDESLGNVLNFKLTKSVSNDGARSINCQSKTGFCSLLDEDFCDEVSDFCSISSPKDGACSKFQHHGVSFAQSSHFVNGTQHQTTNLNFGKECKSILKNKYNEPIHPIKMSEAINLFQPMSDEKILNFSESSDCDNEDESSSGYGLLKYISTRTLIRKRASKCTHFYKNYKKSDEVSRISQKITKNHQHFQNSDKKVEENEIIENCSTSSVDTQKTYVLDCPKILDQNKNVDPVKKQRFHFSNLRKREALEQKVTNWLNDLEEPQIDPVDIWEGSNCQNFENFSSFEGENLDNSEVFENNESLNETFEADDKNNNGEIISGLVSAIFKVKKLDEVRTFKFTNKIQKSADSKFSSLPHAFKCYLPPKIQKRNKDVMETLKKLNLKNEKRRPQTVPAPPTFYSSLKIKKPSTALPDLEKNYENSATFLKNEKIEAKKAGVKKVTKLGCSPTPVRKNTELDKFVKKFEKNGEKFVRNEKSCKINKSSQVPETSSKSAQYSPQ